MLRTYIACALVASLVSCGRKSTIDYNQQVDTTSTVDDRMRDTTKVLVAELPLKFDSTDVLLFTVGMVEIQDRGMYGKVSFDSYSRSEGEFGNSGYSTNDYLWGSFMNIVFRDKDGVERKLTDNKITIRSASFLRDIYRSTKSGYLLYSVSDRDSNHDKKIDHSDLEALYISRIDGTEFKKLTRELHELYDWKTIKGQDRVYLRTLEDKNKDGILDSRDKFHYYTIDFSTAGYSLSEFNPLKVFELL